MDTNISQVYNGHGLLYIYDKQTYKVALRAINEVVPPPPQISYMIEHAEKTAFIIRIQHALIQYFGVNSSKGRYDFSAKSPGN